MPELATAIVLELTNCLAVRLCHPVVSRPETFICAAGESVLLAGVLPAAQNTTCARLAGFPNPLRGEIRLDGQVFHTPQARPHRNSAALAWCSSGLRLSRTDGQDQCRLLA